MDPGSRVSGFDAEPVIGSRLRGPVGNRSGRKVPPRCARSGIEAGRRYVEAVIRMLDPTFNLRRISVKRRQLTHASSGHGLPSRRGQYKDGWSHWTARETAERVLAAARRRQPEQGRAGGSRRDGKWRPCPEPQGQGVRSRTNEVVRQDGRLRHQLRPFPTPLI